MFWDDDGYFRWNILGMGVMGLLFLATMVGAGFGIAGYIDASETRAYEFCTDDTFYSTADWTIGSSCTPDFNDLAEVSIRRIDDHVTVRVHGRPFNGTDASAPCPSITSTGLMNTFFGVKYECIPSIKGISKSTAAECNETSIQASDAGTAACSIANATDVAFIWDSDIEFDDTAVAFSPSFDVQFWNGGLLYVGTGATFPALSADVLYGWTFEFTYKTSAGRDWKRPNRCKQTECYNTAAYLPVSAE
jgi:hypothetical protein